MKIVCVNLRYASDLETAGHEVLNLTLGAGIYSLPELLDKMEFNKPDIFIQEEYLGVRVLFQDMQNLNCLKIFWAIDTHLNMYWQKYYAQLFDVICTPHYSLFSQLNEIFKHNNVHFFPINGSKLPFIPHEKRPYPAQFIGYIEAERSLRKDFAHNLENAGYTVRQKIPYEAMIDFYSMTRILPNEAIAFELNYRLLEGASCGNCILNPDIGSDLALAFEPDKEVLVYKDGLHLLHLLKKLAQNTEKTEEIGKAAQKRIYSSHTRSHRVQQLEGFFTENNKQVQEIYFWLTVYALLRNDNIKYPIETLKEKLIASPTRAFSKEELFKECALLVLGYEQNFPVDEFVEKLEHYADPIALQYLCTYWLLTGNLQKAGEKLKALHMAFDEEYTFAPHKYSFCMEMIPLLKKMNMTCEPGFILKTQRFFPTTMLDFVSYAEILDIYCHEALYTVAHDKIVYQYLPHVSLGALARKSLDFPEDWQLRVDLAACYFRCYRLKDGIYEIETALEMAEKQGISQTVVKYIVEQLGEYALPEGYIC